MAVNREFRRLAAENLAAFLRGDITNFAFMRRARELLEEYPDQYMTKHCPVFKRDASDFDGFAQSVCRQIEVMKDSRIEGQISVRRKQWRRLLRTLAFLETDLEVKDRGPDHRPGWRSRAFPPGLVIFAAVVALLYHFFQFTRPFLFISWLSITPVAIVSTLIWRDRDESQEAYPFKNHRHWREHEYLLDRFNLPEYDPKVHHNRSIYSWRLFLRDYVFNVKALSYVPLALMLCVLLFFAPIIVMISLLCSSRIASVETSQDALVK